jgi:hypothetical protein
MAFFLKKKRGLKLKKRKIIPLLYEEIPVKMKWELKSKHLYFKKLTKGN